MDDRMIEEYEQGDCCPLSEGIEEKGVSFGKRVVRPDEFDAYVDKESARSRARQLGCIGIRQYDSSTGGFVWMPCSNESDYRRVTGRSPLGRRERRRILRNEIEDVIKKKALGPTIGNIGNRNTNPYTAVDADLDRIVLEDIATINRGRGIPDPTPFGAIPEIPQTQKPRKKKKPETESSFDREKFEESLRFAREKLVSADSGAMADSVLPEEKEPEPYDADRPLSEGGLTKPRSFSDFASLAEFAKRTPEEIRDSLRVKKRKKKNEVVEEDYSYLSQEIDDLRDIPDFFDSRPSSERLFFQFPSDVPDERILDPEFVKLIADEALKGSQPRGEIVSGRALIGLRESSAQFVKNFFGMLESGYGRKLADFVDSKLRADKSSGKQGIGPATILRSLITYPRGIKELLVKRYGFDSEDSWSELKNFDERVFSAEYVEALKRGILEYRLPELSLELTNNLWNTIDHWAAGTRSPKSWGMEQTYKTLGNDLPLAALLGINKNDVAYLRQAAIKALQLREKTNRGEPSPTGKRLMKKSATRLRFLNSQQPGGLFSLGLDPVEAMAVAMWVSSMHRWALTDDSFNRIPFRLYKRPASYDRNEKVTVRVNSSFRGDLHRTGHLVREFSYGSEISRPVTEVVDKLMGKQISELRQKLSANRKAYFGIVSQMKLAARILDSLKNYGRNDEYIAEYRGSNISFKPIASRFTYDSGGNTQTDTGRMSAPLRSMDDRRRGDWSQVARSLQIALSGMTDPKMKRSTDGFDSLNKDQHLVSVGERILAELDYDFSDYAREASTLMAIIRDRAEFSLLSFSDFAKKWSASDRKNLILDYVDLSSMDSEHGIGSIFNFTEYGALPKDLSIFAAVTALIDAADVGSAYAQSIIDSPDADPSLKQRAERFMTLGGEKISRNNSYRNSKNIPSSKEGVADKIVETLLGVRDAWGNKLLPTYAKLPPRLVSERQMDDFRPTDSVMGPNRFDRLMSEARRLSNGFAGIYKSHNWIEKEGSYDPALERFDDLYEEFLDSQESKFTPKEITEALYVAFADMLDETEDEKSAEGMAALLPELLGKTLRRSFGKASYDPDWDIGGDLDFGREGEETIVGGLTSALPRLSRARLARRLRDVPESETSRAVLRSVERRAEEIEQQLQPSEYEKEVVEEARKYVSEKFPTVVNPKEISELMDVKVSYETGRPLSTFGDVVSSLPSAETAKEDFGVSQLPIFIKNRTSSREGRSLLVDSVFFASAIALGELPWPLSENASRTDDDWKNLGKRVSSFVGKDGFLQLMRRELSNNRKMDSIAETNYMDMLQKNYVTSAQMEELLADISPDFLRGLSESDTGKMSAQDLTEEESAELNAKREELRQRIERSRFLSALANVESPQNELEEKAYKLSQWKRSVLLNLVVDSDEPNDENWLTIAMIGGFDEILSVPLRKLSSFVAAPLDRVRNQAEAIGEKIPFGAAQKIIRRHIEQASEDEIDRLFDEIATAFYGLLGTEVPETVKGERVKSFGILPDGSISPNLSVIPARPAKPKTEYTFVTPVSPPFETVGEYEDLWTRPRVPTKYVSKTLKTPYGKLINSILDGGLKTGMITWEELPLAIAMDLASGDLTLTELPTSFHEPFYEDMLDSIPGPNELKGILSEVRLADRRFALEVITGQGLVPELPRETSTFAKRDFVATPEQAAQNIAIEKISPMDESSVQAFVNTLSDDQLLLLGDLFGWGRTEKLYPGTRRITVDETMATAARGGITEEMENARKLLISSAAKAKSIASTKGGKEIITSRRAAIENDPSLGEDAKSLFLAMADGDERAVMEAVSRNPNLINEIGVESLMENSWSISGTDEFGNTVTLETEIPQATDKFAWTRNLVGHLLTMQNPVVFNRKSPKPILTGQIRASQPETQKTEYIQESFDAKLMKSFVTSHPVDEIGYRLVVTENADSKQKKNQLKELIDNFLGESDEAAKIIELMTDDEVVKFLVEKVYPAMLAKRIHDKFAYATLAKANAELNSRLRSIGRRMRNSATMATLDLMEEALEDVFEGRTRDMLSPSELRQYGDVVAYYAAGGREKFPNAESYKSALAKLRLSYLDDIKRLNEKMEEEERGRQQIWEDIMDPPIEQSILEALQRAKDPKTAADLAEAEELARIRGKGRIPNTGLRTFEGTDESLGEETFWEIFGMRKAAEPEDTTGMGEGNPFSTDTGRMTVPMPPSADDERFTSSPGSRDKITTRLTKEDAYKVFGEWTYSVVRRRYGDVFGGGRGSGGPYKQTGQPGMLVPITATKDNYDRARLAIDAMYRIKNGQMPKVVEERLIGSGKLEDAKSWLDDLIFATRSLMTMAGIDVPEGYDPTDSTKIDPTIQNAFLDHMAELAAMVLFFPWVIALPKRETIDPSAEDWIPDEDADYIVEGLEKGERPVLLAGDYQNIVASDFVVSSNTNDEKGYISRWIYDPPGIPILDNSPLDQTPEDANEDFGASDEEQIADEEIEDVSPLLEDPEITKLVEFMEDLPGKVFGYTFGEWSRTHGDRYSRIVGMPYPEKKRTPGVPSVLERVISDISSIDADKLIAEFARQGRSGDYDLPAFMVGASYPEVADPDFGPPFPTISENNALVGPFSDLTEEQIKRQRKIGVSSTSKASVAARANWWSLLQSGKDLVEISSTEKTSDGENWHPDVLEEGIRKHAKTNGISDSVVDAAIDAAKKKAEQRNVNTAKLKTLAMLKEMSESGQNVAELILSLERHLKQLEIDLKETQTQYQERTRFHIVGAARAFLVFDENRKKKFEELEKRYSEGKITRSDAKIQARKFVTDNYPILKQLAAKVARLQRESVAHNNARIAIGEEIEQVKRYAAKVAKAVGVSSKVISSRIEIIRAIKNGISSSGDSSDTGKMSVPIRFNGQTMMLEKRKDRPLVRAKKKLLSLSEKNFLSEMTRERNDVFRAPEAAYSVIPSMQIIRSGIASRINGLPNPSDEKAVANSLRAAINDMASRVTAEDFVRDLLGDEFVPFSSLSLYLLPERIRNMAQTASMDGIVQSMAVNGATREQVIGAMIMHSESTERARSAINTLPIEGSADYLGTTPKGISNAIISETITEQLSRSLSEAHETARRLSKSHGERYVLGFLRKKFSDLVKSGIPLERILRPSQTARNKARKLAENAVAINEKLKLSGSALAAVSGSDENFSNIISFLSSQDRSFQGSRPSSSFPEEWPLMNYAERRNWLSSAESLQQFGKFGAMQQMSSLAEEAEEFGIEDGPISAFAYKIFENPNMSSSMMTDQGVGRIFSVKPISRGDFLRSGKNDYSSLVARFPKLDSVSSEGLARFFNSEPSLIRDYRNGNFFLSAQAADRVAKSLGSDVGEIWGVSSDARVPNEGHYYWIAKNWESVGNAISMFGSGSSLSEVASSVGEKTARKVSELIESGIVDSFFDSIGSENLTDDQIYAYLNSLNVSKRRDAIMLMASSGYGEQEIVSTTGFNQNTVRNVLREARQSGIAPAATGSGEWVRKNSGQIRSDFANGISKRELMKKYGVGSRTLNSILSREGRVEYLSAYDSDTGAMKNRRLSERNEPEGEKPRIYMTDEDEKIVKDVLGIQKDILGREIGGTPNSPIVANVANPESMDSSIGSHLNADGTEKSFPQGVNGQRATKMWNSLLRNYLNYVLYGGRIRRAEVSLFQPNVTQDKEYLAQISQMTMDHGNMVRAMLMSSLLDQDRQGLIPLPRRENLFRTENAYSPELNLSALFYPLFPDSEDLQLSRDLGEARNLLGDGAEDSQGIIDYSAAFTPFKPYGLKYRKLLRSVNEKLEELDSPDGESQLGIDDYLKNPKLLYQFIPDDMKKHVYVDKVYIDRPEERMMASTGLNDEEDMDVLAFLAGAQVNDLMYEYMIGTPFGQFMLTSVALGNINPASAAESWIKYFGYAWQINNPNNPDSSKWSPFWEDNAWRDEEEFAIELMGEIDEAMKAAIAEYATELSDKIEAISSSSSTFGVNNYEESLMGDFDTPKDDSPQWGSRIILDGYDWRGRPEILSVLSQVPEVDILFGESYDQGDESGRPPVSTLLPRLTSLYGTNTPSGIRFFRQLVVPVRENFYFKPLAAESLTTLPSESTVMDLGMGFVLPVDQSLGAVSKLLKESDELPTVAGITAANSMGLGISVSEISAEKMRRAIQPTSYSIKDNYPGIEEMIRWMTEKAVASEIVRGTESQSISGITAETGSEIDSLVRSDPNMFPSGASSPVDMSIPSSLAALDKLFKAPNVSTSVPLFKMSDYEALRELIPYILGSLTTYSQELTSPVMVRTPDAVDFTERSAAEIVGLRPGIPESDEDTYLGEYALNPRRWSRAPRYTETLIEAAKESNRLSTMPKEIKSIVNGLSPRQFALIDWIVSMHNGLDEPLTAWERIFVTGDFPLSRKTVAGRIAYPTDAGGLGTLGNENVGLVESIASRIPMKPTFDSVVSPSENDIPAFGFSDRRLGGNEPNEVVDDQFFAYAMDQIFKKLASYGSSSADRLVDETIANGPMMQKVRRETNIPEDSFVDLMSDAKESAKVVAMIISDVIAHRLMREAAKETGKYRNAPFDTGLDVPSSEGEKLVGPTRKWITAARPRRDFYGYWSMYGPDIVYAMPYSDNPVYSPIWKEDKEITRPFSEALKLVMTPREVEDLLRSDSDFSADEILQSLESAPSSWWWEKMPARPAGSQLQNAYQRDMRDFVGERIRLLETSDPYTKLRSGDTGIVTGVSADGALFVQWDSGSNLKLIPGADKFEFETPMPGSTQPIVFPSGGISIADMSPEEFAQYVASYAETLSGRRSAEMGMEVSPPSIPEIMRKAFDGMDLSFEDLPYEQLDEWAASIVSDLNPADVTPERVKEELKKIFPFIGDSDEDSYPIIGRSFEESIKILESMTDPSPGFLRQIIGQQMMNNLGDSLIGTISEMSGQNQEEVEDRLRAMSMYPEIFPQRVWKNPYELLEAMKFSESAQGKKIRFQKTMTVIKKQFSELKSGEEYDAKSLAAIKGAVELLTGSGESFAKLSQAAQAINEHIDRSLLNGEITQVTAFRQKSELKQAILSGIFGNQEIVERMRQFSVAMPFDGYGAEELSRTSHEAMNGYRTVYDAIISGERDVFQGDFKFPTISDMEKAMSDYEKETGRDFDIDSVGVTVGQRGLNNGESHPSKEEYIETLTSALNGAARESEWSSYSANKPRAESENRDLLAVLNGLAIIQEQFYARMRDRQKAAANSPMFGNVKKMGDVVAEISEMTRKNERIRARHKLIGRYKQEVLDPAIESEVPNENLKTFAQWLAESEYSDLLDDFGSGESDTGNMSTTALVASRFVEPAAFSVIYGVDEAKSDGSKFVTNGHILIGAWRAVEAVLAKENFSVSQIASVQKLREALSEVNKQFGQTKDEAESIPGFTANARNAIKEALTSASKRGSDLVDVSDLVSALLMSFYTDGRDDGVSEALDKAGISVADISQAFQNYLLDSPTRVSQSDTGSMSRNRAIQARRDAVKERTRSHLSHRARWFNPDGAYMIGPRDDVASSYKNAVYAGSKIDDSALVDEVERLSDVYVRSLTSGVLPEYDYRGGESPFDDVPERPTNSLLIYGELGQRPNDLVGAIRDAVTRAEALVVNQSQKDRLNTAVSRLRLLFDNYLHVDEKYDSDTGAMKNNPVRTIQEMLQPIEDIFAREEKYNQRDYYEHIFGPIYNVQAELNKFARNESIRAPFSVSPNLRIESDDISWSTNDWVYKRDDKFIEGADAVIIKMLGGDFSTVQVAMIARKSGPFRGAISLVGGLRDGDEDLMTTASREAIEEVGLSEDSVIQAFPLGIIESPDWDPRFINGVRVGGGAFVVPWDTQLSAGSDASGAEWIPLSEIASGKRGIGFGHAEWLRRIVSELEIDPKSDPTGELRTSIARRLSVLSKAARLRNQRMIERINDVRRATGKPLLLSSGKMPHPMMPWGKRVARSVWSFGKRDSSDSDTGSMSALGRQLRESLGLEPQTGTYRSSYITSYGSRPGSGPSTLGFYGYSSDVNGPDPEEFVKTFLDPKNWERSERLSELWIPYIDRSVMKASGGRSTDPTKVPTAFIIGGPSGSGKTYLRETGFGGIPSYDSAIVSDPDDAKIVTPEFAYFAQPTGINEKGASFRDPRIAAKLHEESRIAAMALYYSGLNNGLDVVYDSSGQFRDGYSLGATKRAGYGIKGFYVLANNAMIEDRVESRAQATGRFVDRGMATTIASNLQSIIPQNLHYYDELVVLDSSAGVERMKPIAIYRKAQGWDISTVQNGQIIGEWEVLSPMFFKFVSPPIKNESGKLISSSQAAKSPRKYRKIPVEFSDSMSRWTPTLDEDAKWIRD